MNRKCPIGMVDSVTGKKKSSCVITERNSRRNPMSHTSKPKQAVDLLKEKYTSQIMGVDRPAGGQRL